MPTQSSWVRAVAAAEIGPFNVTTFRSWPVGKFTLVNTRLDTC